MTLVQWLDSLHVDPADEESARLFVVVDEPTTEQEAALHAAREPYAVILGLPSNRQEGLHDGSTILSALVDVHLVQPPTAAGATPGRAKLRRLTKQVAETARHFVTALPDVTLTSRLRLVTETPVMARADNSIWTTIRFRAEYHRT